MDDDERICEICGASMSLNEDGELECDNPSWCPAMGDALDRIEYEDDAA